MKYIQLFLILIIFYGCKTSNIEVSIGTYVREHKGRVKEKLVLNKDSSFIVELNYFIPEVNSGHKSSFEGKWKYINNNTLFLEGSTPPWNYYLINAYVFERVRIVKVLNNKKLKFPIYINGKEKHVVLKKVEYMDLHN